MRNAQSTTIAQLVPVMTNYSLPCLVTRVRTSHAYTQRSGGSGSVASLRLRDATGTIVLSAWGSASARLDQFRVGEAVMVQNCTVKSAKPGSGALYELVLSNEQHQSVAPLNGRLNFDASRPLRDEFVPVSQLGAHVNETLNVLVCVRTRSAVVHAAKPGQSDRQNFSLADKTGSVEMVLWGDDVNHFGNRLNPDVVTIVLLEQVKVEVFRERPQIKLLAMSDIIFAPSMAAGKALFDHFRSTGGPRQVPITSFTSTPTKRPKLTSQDVDSIHDMYFLSSLERLKDAQRSAPVSGWSTCCIESINLQSASGCTYFGCTNCMRRIDQASGRCPNITCASFEPTAMFKLQCSIADSTGALTNVPIFGEAGQGLVGFTASQVAGMNEDQLGALFESLIWTRVTLFWSMDAGNLNVHRVTRPNWAREVGELKRVLDVR